MPEPLRQATHQLVSEAVMNCQEVLRFTEPDVAHDWKRMSLYRATDAADTMNTLALLLAAYCQQHTNTSMETLASYLQTRQQRSRASGPRESDRHEIAGMLGGPVPADDAPGARSYRCGQGYAEGGLMSESDEQRLFTEACLHGLRARLCDDIDSLDGYLPPRVAELARKVAAVLEEPQPAAV
ncbi:hypothetical protein [Streptomyces clavifer]|uniref:hypothetical protein n=1 Tax=Streptomyces clavifer TaxID=68188 RepID=UPI003661A1A8